MQGRPHILIGLIAALCGAPALAAPACTLKSEQLVGAWQHSGGAGFFEQMEFAVEGRERIFNSWLHERPELSGATWSLQGCVLRIRSLADASMTFEYSARVIGGRRLELREAGEPVARYRRIPP